jgi:uncharacterized protein YkwD
MNWSYQNILYHNEKRKDIHPFTVDDDLTKQAFETAEALAREGKLYHRDIPENGLQNIGQGYKNTWLNKPFKVVDLWMQDFNHSYPITSSNFTKIGVGYAVDESSKKVYVVANYK